MGVATKTCTKCKTTYPVSEFYVARKNSDGLENGCKSCRGTETRIRRYRVTPEWIEQQRAKQNGECAICQVPMKTGVLPNNPLAECIDHDHHTNQARALLCSACNRGLGMLKDDPNILQAAADYLVHHRATGVPGGADWERWA